jgi:hypothetical protein
MEFDEIALVDKEVLHPWAGQQYPYPCERHDEHQVTIIDWFVRWVKQPEQDTYGMDDMIEVEPGFLLSILRAVASDYGPDDFVIVTYGDENAPEAWDGDRLRLIPQAWLAHAREMQSSMN